MTTSQIIVAVLVTSGVMGILGGLAVKIIFDWLQNRKDSTSEKKIIKLEARLKQVEKELKEGDDAFKEMQKDIVTIKLATMAIVTWLKAKGQDIDFDTELFSKS